MVETILLAVVAAKIKGYKLKPVFASWHIYPVIAFILAYFILQTAIFMGNYSFIEYSGVFEKLYIFSFLFIILRYRQYASAIIGSAFVVLGTFLNKVAISANGGKMPVFPTLSYLTGYVKPGAFAKANDIHILGSPAVKLKILTDIIDVGYSIMSIGDVCIRLFVFIVVFNAVRHASKAEKINPRYSET